MKYYEQTFKSEIEKNLEFRIKKISPVKLLSVATQFGGKDMASTEQIFMFALENTEVKVLDQWLPASILNATNKSISVSFSNDGSTARAMSARYISNTSLEIAMPSNTSTSTYSVEIYGIK